QVKAAGPIAPENEKLAKENAAKTKHMLAKAADIAAAAAVTPAKKVAVAAPTGAAKDAKADKAAAKGTDKAAVHAGGEKLYKTACVACHSTGVANAPKLGDKAAWDPLLARGMDAIVDVAIKGKGAMPPRGATKADDATLRAAV